MAYLLKNLSADEMSFGAVPALNMARVLSYDDETREGVALGTSEFVDSDGYVIDVDSLYTDEFKALLFSHRDKDFPVGRIMHTEKTMHNNRKSVLVRFQVGKDPIPMAEEVHASLVFKSLTGVSIGYSNRYENPVEMQEIPDDDRTDSRVTRTKYLRT